MPFIASCYSFHQVVTFLDIFKFQILTLFFCFLPLPTEEGRPCFPKYTFIPFNQPCILVSFTTIYLVFACVTCFLCLFFSFNVAYISKKINHQRSLSKPAFTRNVNVPFAVDIQMKKYKKLTQ